MHNEFDNILKCRKMNLSFEFDMKDLKPIEYYIKNQINKYIDNHTMTLHQTNYIKAILT
jgi:hypothetical protein